MVEISMGLLFAAMLVIASRSWQLESWAYTLSLLFLPMFYMGFGLFADGDGIVLKEFLFGIPYFAIAILGLLYQFKWSAYAVAIMWLLHAVYDVVHNEFFINTGVFNWYPYFCAAVDFAIGGYILWSARQWPSASISLAAKSANGTGSR
ncbi:MAG: hypothetical protein AB8B86_16935 [Pseudomonadales bacterium]